MDYQQQEIIYSTVAGGALPPLQEMARTWSLGGTDGILKFGKMLEAVYGEIGTEIAFGQAIAVINGSLAQTYINSFELLPNTRYAIYIQAVYDLFQQTGTCRICALEVDSFEDADSMFPGDNILDLINEMPERRMPLYYISTFDNKITVEKDLRVFIDLEDVNKGIIELKELVNKIIEPVLLWKGSVASGSTTNIVLSEAFTNFRTIRIYASSAVIDCPVDVSETVLRGITTGGVSDTVQRPYMITLTMSNSVTGRFVGTSVGHVPSGNHGASAALTITKIEGLY